MTRRVRLRAAIGTVAAIALMWCPSALGAVSNPRATAEGNDLVLTFTESTKTYGLQWYLDGNAYTVTSRNPSDACTPLSEHPDGMICTFTAPEPTGTVSVSMTMDKPVSPNTQTHLTVDSQGADGQAFNVLVGGTGPTPTATPTPTPTPTATPDPAKKEKKDAAKSDLDPAVAQAIADCSIALGGVGLIGAGTLGSGPSIAAGLPATVAGTLMVDTAGPLCGLALARLKLDYDVIKDPPDANFHQVALPAKVKAHKPVSCRRAPKRGRAACGRLATTGAAFADAASRADAVRRAISTTMNRTSGAVAAGDAAGFALQDASHRVLSGLLARAVGREHTAAGAFTGQLRHDRIHVVLAGAKARKGVALTLKKLAKQGVPTAALRALAGSSLKPKRIDVAKLLARRTPTGGLRALAHGLTAAAAATYLDAVAAQRHITAQKARKQLTAAGAYLPR